MGTVRGETNGGADFGLWMLRQRYGVRTIKSYGNILGRAEVYLKRRLRSATWKDIRSFAETLPCSYASRANLQSALKTYWKFLGRTDCPAWAVVCPKKPRMIPKPIGRQELELVFMAAESLGPVVYAMVACLYYLGLRREEAATLRWDQFSGGRLHVVGKGGVEAYLPVRDEVWEALSDLPRVCPYVFSGRWGNHIAPGTINAWVNTLAEISGVDMHPHRFRHTAITNGYRATRDVFATQAFARHADPRTTKGYTSVDWEAVEAVAAGL